MQQLIEIIANLGHRGWESSQEWVEFKLPLPQLSIPFYDENQNKLNRALYKIAPQRFTRNCTRK